MSLIHLALRSTGETDQLTEALIFPWGLVSFHNWRGREYAYLKWFRALPSGRKSARVLNSLTGETSRWKPSKQYYKQGLKGGRQYR